MKKLCIITICFASFSIMLTTATWIRLGQSIHPGDIRYHNGKPCIVERISIDPETRFLIVDETLLEEL